MREPGRSAGSSFSGVGGFDLGLERAGWGVRWQAESDEWCRRVLAHHWPDVPLYADVRDVAQGDEEPRLPEGGREVGAGRARRDAERARHRPPGFDARVDLLAGGFPCQDVSVAGKRAGLAGARSGLFGEFARIADALRPRWLLIENVPGLLTSNGGRDFGVVLGTLADLGYGLAWRVLDSRYFGVPQRRRRVFVVGRLGGDGASALRPLCEGCPGSPEAVACSWSSPAAGPRDGAHADRVAYAGGGSERGVAPPLMNRTGGHRTTDVETQAFVAYQVGPLTTRTSRLGGDSADGEQFVAYSVTPESGQGADLRAARSTLATGIDVTGLGASTDRGMRIATRNRVRRLTPRECERLQSFPDDWTLLPNTPSPDSRRYGAMGNAVTVNVAEWIGRRLLACDELDLASGA